VMARYCSFRTPVSSIAIGYIDGEDRSTLVTVACAGMSMTLVRAIRWPDRRLGWNRHSDPVKLPGLFGCAKLDSTASALKKRAVPPVSPPLEPEPGRAL
jgi:hypothetical protein